MNLRSKKVFRFGFLLVLLHAFCGQTNASYFSGKFFQPYVANGHYPFWSKTWVKLERRVFLDEAGVPYVIYDSGKSYNTTTISLFGLLAYNRFLDANTASDKEEFLRLANWIAAHQDQTSGCWCHDFDLTYLSMGETIHKPWVSAMTQGLAISMMTRAYSLTHDVRYLAVAERGLLPFSLTVEQGGLARRFSINGGSGGDGDKLFYEEYPTQPAPSFTLNGFMFSLLGLYDLACVPNRQAEELFQKGMRALHIALPLYDMGFDSAYDLGHLTRPPRPIHYDSGYHLVHITLLNALGSAYGDSNLLWYRDQWNSYGQPWEGTALWLRHFAIWLLFRQTALIAAAGIAFILVFFWMGRAILRGRGRRTLATPPTTCNLAMGNRFAATKPSAGSAN